MKTTIVLGLLSFTLTILAAGWQVGGIGITTTRESDHEQWRIASVFSGSPAEVAGIKTNWLVISVDGTNVVSMSSCMRVVCGSVGTSVTLELADPTMSRTNKFTIKRADVEIPDDVFPDGLFLKRASLTAEQATAEAERLANDKAFTLYQHQPFVAGQPAQFVAGHWHWVVRQGFGLGDIEATVELAADGSTNHVDLQLLYNQNTPGGGGRGGRGF